MKLAGQGRQDGYAMAALLVAMTVMAVMMTVAMPVWTRISQREKEEELVFRGEQYARAIGLFQRKFANAAPPTIDLLVEQKFLRKKYKDPMTNSDFVPVTQSQLVQASATPGRTGAPQPTAGAGARPGGPGTTQPGSQAGGIIGVTSRSTQQSVRLYKGRNHYNEWQFLYAPPAAAPGQGGQGPGQQAQPGQQGLSPRPRGTAPQPQGPSPRPGR